MEDKRDFYALDVEVVHKKILIWLSARNIFLVNVEDGLINTRKSPHKLLEQEYFPDFKDVSFEVVEFRKQLKRQNVLEFLHEIPENSLLGQ